MVTNKASSPLVIVGDPKDFDPLFVLLSGAAGVGAGVGQRRLNGLLGSTTRKYCLIVSIISVSASQVIAKHAVMLMMSMSAGRKENFGSSGGTICSAQRLQVVGIN